MRLLAENRVEIDCPTELVWKATIAIEDWPKWTPTVNSAARLDQGGFGLGSEARLKQPGQAQTVWRVTDFEAGRRFFWDAKVNGIPMRAGHVVVKTPQGSESIMTVHVSGLIAILLWPLLKAAVGRTIALENRSLKGWCEGNFTSEKTE